MNRSPSFVCGVLRPRLGLLTGICALFFLPGVNSVEAAARSVQVVFHNHSDKTLTLDQAELAHGIWTKRPPRTIAPNKEVDWASESDGFLTGTEGRAAYHVHGHAHAKVELHWDNPFAGSNSYDEHAPAGFHLSRQGGAGDNASIVWTLKEMPAHEYQLSWMFVEPASPPVPDEKCNPKEILADFCDPVDFLVEEKSEGRLIWPLRAAAQGKIETTLSLSAAAFALAREPHVSVQAPPLSSPVPANLAPIQILHGGLVLLRKKAADIAGSREALAAAFADLAVTGRRAHAEFRRSPPSEGSLAEQVKQLLKGVSGIGPDDIAQGTKQALARAKQVDAYLSAIIPDRSKRQGLGWIAVSAEDDQPYRPVNIPSLPYPQYNIKVPVRAPTGAIVNVDTRFAIISNHKQPTPEPHIPATDVVLLFIHGDSSRLEEVGPLIQPLLAAGARHGVSYTIIAMDLPSHGYTTMLDPLGPFFHGTPPWNVSTPVHRPPSYPVLEFLEHFIVSFVATLDQKTHVAKQLLGPIGGSLGGNMSLRLARRTEPWIKQSIAWSPASLWDSFADDFARESAPNHCSTNGHAPELEATRADFFKDQFQDTHLFGFIKAQGEYWYRQDWPCKPASLLAGRKERREIYNPIFRQWHYRMDWEQLVYSYRDPDKGSKDPRWKSFHSRLLLAAGSEDNNIGAHIYTRSIDLAQFLTKTNAHGRTFFIEHTGHSIHDERPILWAAQIDAFSTETRSGARTWINASGKPLVRLTGKLHDWTSTLQVATADVGKPVLQLILTIKTGDHDLPGGPNSKDNADVTLKLQSGQSVTIPNINRAKRWGDRETHSVQLFFPPELHLKAGDIKNLTVHTHFGAGVFGKNWNIDQVVLHAIVGGTHLPGIFDTSHGPLDERKLDLRPVPSAPASAWERIWADNALTDKGSAALHIDAARQPIAVYVRERATPGGKITFELDAKATVTTRTMPPLPGEPKGGPAAKAAVLGLDKGVELALYGAYSKATGKLVAYRIRYRHTTADGKALTDLMLAPAQDPPR
jgi:pimeloyl-ACP methyl ester carboxylesterase